MGTDAITVGMLTAAAVIAVCSLIVFAFASAALSSFLNLDPAVISPFEESDEPELANGAEKENDADDECRDPSERAIDGDGEDFTLRERDACSRRETRRHQERRRARRAEYRPAVDMRNDRG